MSRIKTFFADIYAKDQITTEQVLVLHKSPNQVGDNLIDVVVTALYYEPVALAHGFYAIPIHHQTTQPKILPDNTYFIHPQDNRDKHFLTVQDGIRKREAFFYETSLDALNHHQPKEADNTLDYISALNSYKYYLKELDHQKDPYEKNLHAPRH